MSFANSSKCSRNTKCTTSLSTVTVMMNFLDCKLPETYSIIIFTEPITLNLLDPKKYSTLFYLYLLFLKYMYILKSIINNAGCRIMKWSSKTLLKLSGFSRDQWSVSKRAAPSPNLLANIHTPTNRRLNMVFRNQSYSFKRKMKPRN